MPQTSSPEATNITPISHATNADFEKFFGDCGDDTRRKIFRHLGLPKRKKQPWGEFWNAVGLDPEQPEKLWEDLTHGSDGKKVLWNAARVADETGLAAPTVNGTVALTKPSGDDHDLEVEHATQIAVQAPSLSTGDHSLRYSLVSAISVVLPRCC